MLSDRYAAILVFVCSFAQADHGPFIQSSEYAEGKFGAWPTETYRSTSIVGPALNYLESSPQCKDGQYTFVAPRGLGVATPGPTIIDQDGHLVWSKNYGQTYNLNMYQFKGQSYLTFWLGNDAVAGHGEGVYYMLDSSYEEAYKIQGANALPADLHEFHITVDETAVFTIYEVRRADLRSVEDGPEDGWIYDGTFQEVDVETGELLFQWRASEHFNFTEVYRGREGAGESKVSPWDFFHINSVDKDANGNFLISARYTNSLIYIDGRSGSIIWRLGGKHNSFQDLSDGKATNIAWQHHARFHENGSAITLFDNASRGEGAPSLTSRGLYLDINTEKMTVAVRHEYCNPHSISSQSQGSLQVLDTGNVLVGYGYNAAWTEYSIHGDVLCHVHFGPETDFGRGDITSYRVFKHPWVGRPRTRPDIAVYAYEAAVSWNGATEVAAWVLQGINPESNTGEDDDDGDATSNRFRFLAAVPKSGFETIIPIPFHVEKQSVRVVGVNATGHVLGASQYVDWDPASPEAVVMNGVEEKKDNKARSTALRSFVFFVLGFFSAVVLAAGAWAVYRCCVLSAVATRKSRARGDWIPIENDGFISDEYLSDGDMSDDIEFSLLGNPRLASYENLGQEFDRI
ncbi:hypothetical protein EYZ11_001065 [Aspergillus tanneri]|uniref:ASST-domain-containing protein n=1 Tax=Aspergillus tanneri TaxID=1220188 RepID=A0A4S3JVJ8_9EURO|nr:uncharacterized protein ATNIH1004_009693 [Aspergillus tanneri]KAA8642932.1 hypothetical protein ATNIH1004_009693 [Aspergillus tanneri]THC99427.1 hypothetical protein EYZ11_001065 [Aspergillus tanneri]